jgi:predicted flap endonuclease-1-like 5' DNA nuclease
MNQLNDLVKLAREAPNSRSSLPISKLRGVPQRVRVALKTRRITSCGQLLHAAGKAELRANLAEATGIDPELLTILVQRADMTRVSGVGAIFGLMLEDLGVRDVQTLAAQDPVELHRRLREYNQRVRLARRSPTPEEVADWVAQARRLEPLVTY